jgi:hypothetical protein
MSTLSVVTSGSAHAGELVPDGLALLWCPARSVQGVDEIRVAYQMGAL